MNLIEIREFYSNDREEFTIKDDQEFSMQLLKEYINQHRIKCKRYLRLKNTYEGFHSILEQEEKEQYKPDNRLVMNYAKYIVDTLNGFFMGIPVNYNHDNEQMNERLKTINSYNDVDDLNSEISKLVDIYGEAHEMHYVDEFAQPCFIELSPVSGFIIFDNSIRRKYRYYVNYDIVDSKIKGSYSDSSKIFYFEENEDKELYITEEREHYYNGVPVVQYKSNSELMGAFEPVITLIDGINKAISEKANDVDYFSDAYLKILGAMLEEEDLRTLRDSRIINLSRLGSDKNDIVVDFLEKPSVDTTQENLLERLISAVFMISQTVNLADDTFTNTSGVSLEYKMQPMSNLLNNKERKFTSSFNRRYKLICSLPNIKMNKDEWLKIKYKFTRNKPQNVKEETDIARNLKGIISDESIIETLSIVENAKKEYDKLKLQEYDGIEDVRQLQGRVTEDEAI